MDHNTVRIFPVVIKRYLPDFSQQFDDIWDDLIIDNLNDFTDSTENVLRYKVFSASRNMVVSQQRLTSMPSPRRLLTSSAETVVPSLSAEAMITLVGWPLSAFKLLIALFTAELMPSTAG